MNLILALIGTVLCFSSILIIEKLLGKEGLYVWMSVATIIANIIVCKTIEIGGFSTSLGNIMFASNYLAADILTEKYGKEYADKSINNALVSIVIFLIVTQFCLLFVPAPTDLAQGSMEILFNLNVRVSISSMLLFFMSNRLEVYLFSWLAQKYPDKLWLRNNVSTILCNCLENFFFAFIAFYGIYDVSIILSIATVGSVIEIVIALIDTPFLYISKYLIKTEEDL